jgi:hypothetical protein
MSKPNKPSKRSGQIMVALIGCAAIIIAALITSAGTIIAVNYSKLINSPITTSSSNHSPTVKLNPISPLSSNILYMAWKGVSGDQAIYWASFDGSDWSGQKGIPLTGTSNAPALVVFHGKLYMAWKGIGGIAMYRASFDGSNWSTPQRIPDKGTSDAPILAAF